jgi:hypothetical protein
MAVRGTVRRAAWPSQHHAKSPNRERGEICNAILLSLQAGPREELVKLALSRDLVRMNGFHTAYLQRRSRLLLSMPVASRRNRSSPRRPPSCILWRLCHPGLGHGRRAFHFKDRRAIGTRYEKWTKLIKKTRNIEEHVVGACLSDIQKCKSKPKDWPRDPEIIIFRFVSSVASSLQRRGMSITQQPYPKQISPVER